MSYVQIFPLSIPLLRQAYDHGLFPMADHDGTAARISWYCPEIRAVFRPQNFHVSKRLGRLIRQLEKTAKWRLAWNDDFREVITSCAQARVTGNWINPVLIEAYTAWASAGEAFCLSVFDGENRIGGIYGVRRGGIFMAESMFSRIPNASSVALVSLIAGLAKAGIELVDAQFANPHTERFNLQSMRHEDYLAEIARLREKPVTLQTDHFTLAEAVSFVQSLTQTS